MNTSRINKALKNVPNFIGTYPRDLLPKTKRKNFSLVINTDPAHRPGEHWVAIVCKNKKAIYFDSYGIKPFHKEIKKFLNLNTDGWTYNKTRFQGLTSETCGHYVILFVVLRSAGVSLKKIVTLFSDYAPANDKIIQYLL